MAEQGLRRYEAELKNLTEEADLLVKQVEMAAQAGADTV